jgi:hypothetical protein
VTERPHNNEMKLTRSAPVPETAALAAYLGVRPTTGAWFQLEKYGHAANSSGFGAASHDVSLQTTGVSQCLALRVGVVAQRAGQLDGRRGTAVVRADALSQIEVGAASLRRLSLSLPDVI